MSGLAEILLEEDFTISGSDAKKSPLTMSSWKTRVQRSTTDSALPTFPDDVEVVVYTAAIHPDNPEFACAKEKGSPDADKSTASRTDHAQLRHSYCSCRHAWKDHNYFHDFPHSSEGRMRPYHQRRRYPSCDRRQYPCRTVRDLC